MPNQFQLTVQQWDIDKVIPYVNNTKKHPPEQIDKLASMIAEYGFDVPIVVDGDGVIIKGHGRLQAFKKLNALTVPVVVRNDLTPAQCKAARIADNKIAESEWDMDLLKIELEELTELDFDLDLTGFGDLDLGIEESNEGLTEENDVPETPAEPITKIGDVWLCGNHRVMCGDSTSIDAVDKLMNGEKVDMIFTDPPYNMGFNGRSGKHNVIKNDDLNKEDFEQFINDVCQTIKYINPQVYYIWCNWKFYGILQDKLDYNACIVWAKNVFGLGCGYRYQHEFCLFNGKIDEMITNESDLWEVKKDHNYIHPTQKPVALSIRAFGNHVKLLNILDLFGGSGSTLIGAEKSGRTAYLMELDPKYCDVIVKRWQDFTGKKATLESTGEFFNG